MRPLLFGLCGLMACVQVCAFQRLALAQVWNFRSGRASLGRPVSVDAEMKLPTPVRNKELEAKARAYFALGNNVKQQLGPTRKEDLEAALADDFEFVAPLVGPL